MSRNFQLGTARFRITRTAGGLVFLAALLASLGPAVFAQQLKTTLRFAADMAREGNWREAQYRWEGALREAPDDYRVLNNLGVAAEALGQIDQAEGYYRKALAAAEGEPRITDNYRRHARFVAQTRGSDDDSEGMNEGDGAMPLIPPGDGKKRGKTDPVRVLLPVPPKLELEGIESLLVASFRALDAGLIDTNRDLVRYLRGEFRKQTALDVLDINPPPAIPEQTVDDLLANSAFWREMSTTYGADLIVSGIVLFDRSDYSGFQDVDTISPTTGQKVRQMQFVEQEKFVYRLDIFFIEGPTGKLLFRDRVEQGLIFGGSMNDPISAFYELSDQIAREVLSVLVPLRREEPRYIFKK